MEQKTGENERISRIRRAVYIAAPLFIFIITYILVLKETGLEKNSDVASHMRKCLSFEEMMSVSHNGWHIVCYLLYEMLPIPIETAASIASALFNAFACVLTIWLCEHMMKPDYSRKESFWLVSFLSASALIIGPLYLRFYNPRYYVGQSSPNPWHSPTTMGVRPFALLITILTAFLWDCGEEETTKAFGRVLKRKTVLQIWLGILLLAATLIKPSILTIYLPVCGVRALICLVKGKGRNLLTLIRDHLYFLPSAALFLFQFMKIYIIGGTASAKTTEGIEIALFKVTNMAAPFFPVSVVLRMAFPFAVIIIWRKIVFKDTMFKISFWQYVAGMLVFWIFAEKGSRASHGNFGWGNVIASSVLWIWCLIFFVRQWKSEGPAKESSAGTKAKFIVPACLFFWHLAAGSAYYFHVLHNMAGQL